MSENPAKPTLYAKLAVILGEVARIPKSGKHQQPVYRYATNEDVLDTVRPLLAAQNIAFFASMVECSQAAEPTKSGDTQTRTHVVVEFTFADAESGEVVAMRWHGESLEKGDKGINKAATQAKKYFLLNTFLISTGDLQEDPDADALPEPAADRMKSAPTNGEEGWPSAKLIEELIGYWQGQGLKTADILRYAQVRAVSNRDDWGKYPSRQAATIAIRDAWQADKPAQTAFQQARNGKPPAAPALPDIKEEVETAAIKPPF